MQNRQLKFRAWDKKNKAMRDIWSITWDFTPETPKMILACNPVINAEYALHEGEFEILQSTGLKDKNGTEIYEGDIIDYGNGRHYPITYEANGFGIKFNHGHERNWLDLTKFEVVGNIYQQHELLKQNI